MYWFWIAFLSALFSAAAAVTQKKILFSLSALEFSFLLSLVLLVLSLWIPFTVSLETLSYSVVALLLFKSLLGATGFFLVMLALKKNEISSALPLLGITPAATALIAFFFLDEVLLPQEWLGIGLMIVGTFLVEKRQGMNIWQSIRSSHTQLVIAGAVLFFALSSVADRFLLARLQTDPFLVLFFQHLVYAIFFGIVILVHNKSLRPSSGNRLPLLKLILVVAFLTFAYRYTQLEATKLAPVALVLAVKRLSILFASFVGGKFFAEERLPLKLAGAACIVASGFFILRHIS